MNFENQNAWVVILGSQIIQDNFSVCINQGSGRLSAVKAGDPVLLVSKSATNWNLTGIAVVFRKQQVDFDYFLYFDRLKSLKDPYEIVDIGNQNVSEDWGIFRVEWDRYLDIIEKAKLPQIEDIPLISGATLPEQSYIRTLMQKAVVDDIMGPADGPTEEIIGMSVRDRYLVGKLSPMTSAGGSSRQNAFADDDSDGQTPNDLRPYVNDDHISRDKVPTGQSNDDDDQEVNASENQSLVPSSMGLTFCVDRDLEVIDVYARWGRYERTHSEEHDESSSKPKRCWKRRPSGGSIEIHLNNRVIAPIQIDKDCSLVYVQGSVSEAMSNGDKLVTLFLVNAQTLPEQNQDEAWVFQPEIIIRSKDGKSVFRRRPILRSNEFDSERESLEMIYRERVEFAVGHGVSVHAKPSIDDYERAFEIRTVVLPEYEIPVTETPGLEPDDREAMKLMINNGFLDMQNLADLQKNELISGLRILTADYCAWIKENQSRIHSSLKNYENTAVDAMQRCETILQRLEAGIAVLDSNDQALLAFRFANKAMATQRIQSIYALHRRRGDSVTVADFNIRKNRSWRPFQLAFMLLSIPALANPTHEDRTEPLEAYADLLWFPTGGGKTEAYLGVAAFTMGIRRLQGCQGGYDGSRGLAVIMRYTLRLLTLQQFQRATVLICAMDIIRRSDVNSWGNEPFTIGLWVGQKVTPNTTEESHSAIEKERDGKYGTGSTPAQLTSCPWCGSEINPGRDIVVNREIGRTHIFCGDKYGRCEFSKVLSPDLGIPVLVVDDEIYRHPPTMLIATVDKFAMMAWRGQVRTLFGKVTQECERHGLLWPEAPCNGNHTARGKLLRTSVKRVTPIRPPDLIIQDEFHLISGPLGTMVGLYETAVDELSTWELNGKRIRPKIIASTATVRKAEEQVNNVFLRKVSVFPPHGVDIEDNFFSVQRPVGNKPGRLYMGICSPGSSRPAVLIRVYVALLTAAQSLFEHFGQVADPYMTVVGYFNSLRELGGMRRLAEDDVQTRAYRVQMSDVKRPGLSQRSVRNVDELTSRVSSKDIPKKLDLLELKFKKQWEKGEARAIDIVLATNMLSVGVDVNRIGLMVVNGQPKNTAEYIQATSRVGRAFPGLVCTVLTWTRPRDLSHYETFEHYHATFYKHVEAQSVTPFAARALDRGLMGTMVGCLRLNSELMASNSGAQSLLSSGAAEANLVKDVISERAWKVKGKAAKILTEQMVADRIDRWVNEAIKPGRRLGYETASGQGDMYGLLKKPGAQPWDEYTVPMSMREVEPGVQLVMDDTKLNDAPLWQLKKTKHNIAGGEA